MVDRIDADSDRGNPGGIGDFGFIRGLMSPEFWDLSVLLPEYISDTRIMAE